MGHDIKKNYKGIMFILLSAFSFALMNTFARLAGDIPSVQKSFFRNFIAFGVALVVLRKNHIPLKCKKSSIWILLIRASCGTLGILCNFYAIDNMVLADANMLNKMSPFFVIIFSYIFLKEKVTMTQAIAVITAFVGSLLIIKPSVNNIEIVPALIGLLGGLMAGAAYTAVRSLGNRGEKGPFIVFFFSGFSCIVTLPYLIIAYHEMTAIQLLFLILAGVAATGGQFAITAAYCHAPAKEISVYDYSQVLFSAIIGFIVFGQLPDVYSIIGYVVICLVAVAMFIDTKRRNNINNN